MNRDAQGMWIGGIAAGVVLLVIFLVLRFTSVKIPIGPFFLVTSILMAVLVSSSPAVASTRSSKVT